MRMRICKSCGATEDSVRWITLKGKNRGLLCLACKAGSTREWRATPEGKARNSEASRRFLATTEGREKHNEATRKIRATPEGSTKARESSLYWKKENPDKVNALNAKYRVSKLTQALKNSSSEDKLVIGSKYAMARWLSEVVGVPYHVDHIIPLKGRIVSGLHVPGNLCIIHGSENMAKGNKWAP